MSFICGFSPKLLVQSQEIEIEACFLREDEQPVASAQSFPDVASSHLDQMWLPHVLMEQKQLEGTGRALLASFFFFLSHLVKDHSPGNGSTNIQDWSSVLG